MIPKSAQKGPQSRQNLIKILYLYKTPSLKVFFPIFLGLGAESDDFQAQLGLQGGWCDPSGGGRARKYSVLQNPCGQANPY